MWIMLFAFLRTPIGKYAISFVVIAGLAFSALKFHDHQVKQEALVEYNRKQIEQVMKDKERFDAGLKALQESEKSLEDQLKLQRDRLEKGIADLDKFLDSDEAKKHDRASSEILKRTVKELQELAR